MTLVTPATMEHCFRAAACLILVFSLLQAMPTPAEDTPSESTNFLEGVSCGKNMTFTSPTNVLVKDHCFCPALKVMMDELKRAKTNCTDQKNNIGNTLEKLESTSNNLRCSSSGATNSSECTWQQDQKGGFEEAIRTVFEQIATNGL